MGGNYLQLLFIEQRLERLERLVIKAKGETLKAQLRASAADKLRLHAHLTRPEAAAYLDVSTKKLQRMEAKSLLQRCPRLGSVVRYRASDVLRLASAPNRKED